jgi:hypothetical protein
LCIAATILKATDYPGSIRRISGTGRDKPRKKGKPISYLLIHGIVQGTGRHIHMRLAFITMGIQAVAEGY